MTHQYQVTGMTCNGCVAKVKSELLKHTEILSAEVNLPDTAVITMNKHITLNELQQTISKEGRYIIKEDEHDNSHDAIKKEESISWLNTYKPLLLIFGFITAVSYVAARTNYVVDWMAWMQYFMAGFFLTFSFFKFLDLKGFAESYAMYDLLAMRVPAYGYVYPFIELGLGIAYLINFNMQITNIATIVVMGFSSIGVIQSVMNKRKIRCACLGAVFNLPMSTVTIIEDLLMVLMAGLMLILKF